MSLLLNMQSRFVIAFLLRSKQETSFNFMAAITIQSDFGAQENNICLCCHFFPFHWSKMMGPDVMILVFLMLGFKPDFSLSCFTLIK